MKNFSDPEYVRDLHHRFLEEQGALKIVKILLTRRFGPPDPRQWAQVQVLGLDKLGDLAEAVLDFKSIDDLEPWLAGTV